MHEYNLFIIYYLFFLIFQFQLKDGPMPLMKLQQMPLFSNTVTEAPGVLITKLMNSERGRARVNWEMETGVDPGPLMLFSWGHTQLVSWCNPCMAKPYPWG